MYAANQSRSGQMTYSWPELQIIKSSLRVDSACYPMGRTVKLVSQHANSRT